MKGTYNKGTYSVTVGNIGTVLHEVGKQEAMKAYREYVSQSKDGYGRARGEDVYMMKGDEIVYEYTGTLSRIMATLQGRLSKRHGDIIKGMPIERPGR